MLCVLSSRICLERTLGPLLVSGSALPTGRLPQTGVFLRIGGPAGIPFPGDRRLSANALAGPARAESPPGSAGRTRKNRGCGDWTDNRAGVTPDAPRSAEAGQTFSASMRASLRPLQT